jgi:carbon-monoxide dehydrogenase small subunit
MAALPVNVAPHRSVEWRTHNSCMVLAVECDGAQIVTVEGLMKDQQLDPIQTTMIESGGVQCGFCTPGILISARARLTATRTLKKQRSAKPLLVIYADARLRSHRGRH